MDDSSILLDTNVLLEATTPARELHRAALVVLNDWPNRGVRLCVSGQILREYLAVATRDPDHNGLGLRMTDALANVETFIERCRFLSETREVTDRLRSLLRSVPCTGKQVHDANLVATCLAHDVAGLVTANLADFQRFSSQVEVKVLGG